MMTGRIKMVRIPVLLMVQVLFLFISCSDSSDVDSVSFGYDFDSREGWAVGFSDYPVGQEEFYELSYEVTTLPSNIGSNIPALKISGNNHSDDLFMYAKKRIVGLRSNTTYELRFNLSFATNESNESVGVGGSPGSGVYVKAGAYFSEPVAVEDNGYYLMNFDKGDQSEGGQDAVVLGTFGDSNPPEDTSYRMNNLNSDSNPLTVTTSDLGILWIVVGTDSGFEATTTIYYYSLSVKIDRK
ncbi:hypothetical protein ACFL6G_00115 [candidate division KSB1 bacterium]